MTANDHPPCGLVFYFDENAISIPLKEVKVSAEVLDFIAKVCVEQKYKNLEANPIEVTYFFPIEAEAAVIDFEAIVNGRSIETFVKDADQARLDYDNAIQATVLLEKLTSHTFSIMLGQLNPGSEATIRLTYVTELQAESKLTRITIPTSIAPRYISPPSDQTGAAKRFGSLDYSSKSTDATVSLEMNIKSGSKIESVSSPSHELETYVNDLPDINGIFNAKAFATGTSHMDRDIVVIVANEDPSKPKVVVEKSGDDPNSVAVMISVVPTIRAGDQKCEFVFLVDRSESMGSCDDREKIKSAREALNILLHSLPVGSTFNIFSFGSTFDSLFHKSVNYNDHNLMYAKNHVNSMSANYSGTDIYSPLEAIFKKSKSKKEFHRQIFVLTDGVVSNADSVIELIKENSSKARVFSLGLGSSASRHLVKGIARAGNGQSLFAVDGEDLRPKVMTLLKSSLQPTLSDLEIEWEDDEHVPKGETWWEFTAAPQEVGPIFDGSRLLVYRLFDPRRVTPKRVNISAKSPNGDYETELAIEEASYVDGNLVHQGPIQYSFFDLEESEQSDDVKQTIIQLGVKYRLASRFTSFVGVDKSEQNGNGKKFRIMETRSVHSHVVLHPLIALQSENVYESNTEEVMPKSDVTLESDKEDFTGSNKSDFEVKVCSRFNNCETFVVTDDVTVMINLQHADGHFEWDDNLFLMTFISESALEKRRPDYVSTKEVWLTAFVVALLEDMPKQKEIWELVVEKAKKFLGQSLTPEEVGKVISDAAKKNWNPYSGI